MHGAWFIVSLATGNAGRRFIQPREIQKATRGIFNEPWTVAPRMTGAPENDGRSRACPIIDLVLSYRRRK